VTRIPKEWRIPVAFVVLWLMPLVVGDSLLLRTHGRAVVFAVGLSLLIGLTGSYELLRRSQLAWWVLVVIFAGGFVEWVYHVDRHGLGVAWALWGALGVVNLCLLVSAPMRRFVRFRGRLAPDSR